MSGAENKIILSGIVSMQALPKIGKNYNYYVINGDKSEGAIRKGILDSNKKVNVNSECCKIIFSKIEEALSEHNPVLTEKVKQSFIENYNGSISTTLGKAFNEISSQVFNTSKIAQNVWSEYANEIMINEINKLSGNEDIIVAPPPKVAQNSDCIVKLKEKLGENSEIVYLNGPIDMNSFLAISLTTSVFTNHYNNMKEILLRHYTEKEEQDLIKLCGEIILLKKNDDLEMKAKFELFKLLAQNTEAKMEFKKYIENQLLTRNTNAEKTILKIGGKVEVLKTSMEDSINILKPEYSETDKAILKEISFGFVKELKREAGSILGLTATNKKSPNVSYVENLKRRKEGNTLNMSNQLTMIKNSEI